MAFNEVPYGGSAEVLLDFYGAGCHNGPAIGGPCYNGFWEITDSPSDATLGQADVPNGFNLTGFSAGDSSHPATTPAHVTITVPPYPVIVDGEPSEGLITVYYSVSADNLWSTDVTMVIGASSSSLSSSSASSSGSSGASADSSNSSGSSVDSNNSSGSSVEISSSSSIGGSSSLSGSNESSLSPDSSGSSSNSSGSSLSSGSSGSGSSQSTTGSSSSSSACPPCFPLEVPAVSQINFAGFVVTAPANVPYGTLLQLQVSLEGEVDWLDVGDPVGASGVVNVSELDSSHKIKPMTGYWVRWSQVL